MLFESSNSSLNDMTVLYLPSIYPNKCDPTHGVFIKRHVLILRNAVNAHVVFAYRDIDLPRRYEIGFSEDQGVTETAVAYKGVAGNSFIAKSINMLCYYNACIKGLLFYLKKYKKPDMINVCMVNPIGIIAVFARFVYKIPFLITEHNTIFVDHKRYENLIWPLRWAIKVSYYYSSYVTVVSSYLGAGLTKLKLVQAGKYNVTPNVCLINDVEVERPKLMEITKILTIASLHDFKKNISGLLRVVAELLDEGFKIELDIVGEGPDRQMLLNYAKELGVLDNVRFCGRILPEEVVDYFKQAHFFVLASHVETFSVATLEALVCGLPVVVTKCNGPEGYVDSSLGICVEQTDLSLKEGIKKMINSWSLYDSKEISSRARKMFSDTEITSLFMQAYLKVINKDV